MKRLITLLAALAATTAISSAQTDTLAVFDTTEDRFEITIGGFSITSDDDCTDNSHKDTFFFSAEQKNKVTTNFLGIGLGGMALTQMPFYGPWEDQKGILDIYPASSTRIDLYLISWTIPLDRRGRTYYRIGMQYTFDSFKLRNNITFKNDDEGYLMPEELTGQIKSTRLKGNYWGLNMGLGFMVNEVMIMVEGTAELLTKSCVKYKNPTKNIYQIDGFNPFRSRIGISTSWEGFGFYLDYSLTPVFKSGTGNDAHSISLGCRLGF